MKYIQSQSSIEREVSLFAAKFKEYIESAINGKEPIDSTKIITLENQARMLIRRLKDIPGTEELRKVLLELVQESAAIEAKEDLRRFPKETWTGD